MTQTSFTTMVESGHARSFATLLILLAAAACAPAIGVALGEELFETCAPCHGASGVGNPDLAAPAIAGLPQWYVEAQLEGFQSGFRGKHADDLPGLRMRPMAVSLNREGDIPSVAEYVASLTPSLAPSTLHGNAGAGAEIYHPMRRVSWDRRSGERVVACAADRPVGRLVPRARAPELQTGCARHRSRRYMGHHHARQHTRALRPGDGGMSWPMSRLSDR